MIPILFNKDEKTFTSLGLGQMDATLVEVERERNGNYTLYAEVPFNSPQAKHLTKEMLIKADAGSRTKWQTFKINRTIKDTNANVIKVYADHISMDTINDAMKPKVVIRQQTAEGALRQWANSLVSGKAYDVQSDITHVGSTEWTIDEVENARQALGGVSGSILDVWGGEYEFDNNRIILHKEMGRTAPTVLEYGRNIVSLEYEELIDGVYTSIYPYATYTPKSKDNKQLPDIMVTLDELIVDSEYAGNYETRRIQIVDFSNEFDSNAENPEIPTQAKLRTLAKAYVKNNGYGIPKISQEIDFVDLSKTLDYQDIQVMEEIELNDRVPVYYPNIDAETNDVKVTTTNWDVLNNRYSKITLSTIGAMNSNSITSKLNTAIKDLKAEQKKINNTVPYLINGQGNRVWYTTPDDNMEHKIGDTWFKKNGKYTIILKWNGSMWEEFLNDETFITEIEAEVESAISKAEDAQALAVSEAESALVQAKSDATAKANAIKEQITGEVNTAISTAEDAKALAISEAENALALAKADATTKANAIKEQVSGEVNTAISTAETAKALAVSEAEQALIDAKAHADAEVQASKEYFDGLIVATQSDVADAQATANSAVEQIDTAVLNAGFTSLDDTIQNMNSITTNAEQNAQEAISNANNAYGLAQTSISEAQTAQANSLTALGKANNALDGVSNLDVRVDDVEGELELKADNTFINEDGTLTTLSNAITFNANRFSSDMSRIESRVESLAGEINLVILRDAIEGKFLGGGDTYPTPNSNGTNHTMRDLIDVEPGEQLALSKNSVTGGDRWWRINFYDDALNYTGYIHRAENQEVITVPLNATKMWVSYPGGSQPQIVRGTNFIPYRPNFADQMTSNEMVLFRNEYDEYADRTERRLSAIDSTGGSLDILDNKIVTTAEQVTTDMTALVNTKVGSDEFTEFYQNEYLEMAQEVSRKISLTDVKPGNRNYLKGSNKITYNGSSSPLAGYTNKSNGAFEFVTQSYLAYLTLKLGGVFAQSIFVDEKIGMEFVASFEIKSNNPVANNLLFFTGLDTRYLAVKGATTINNKWQRVYIKGEFGGGTWQPHLQGFVGNTLYEIRNFMVEKGNVLGDWNLAYEDTENKISNIQTEWTQTFATFEQTITGEGGINTQLQMLDKTMSSIADPTTGRLTIAEQNLNGFRNEVYNADGSSKITQIAQGVQSVAEEKKIEARIPGAQRLHQDTRFKNWAESPFIVFDSANTNSILISRAEHVAQRISTPPSGSSGILRVRHSSDNTHPGLGGIALLKQSRASQIVVVEFYARVPIGYKLNIHQNALGDNYESGWLTESDGTGNWERYAYYYKMGSTGTFATYGYVYLTGDAPPTPDNHVVWYVDTYQVYDLGKSDMSAITQLTKNINLLVSKGDVINQINVSTEGILIDGKKTHITGTTTIDDGVIKNAHIANLHADKIKSGTIDSARIDAKKIVTDGLTADVIESTHIKSSTGLIDKIFADEALITHLTSNTIFASKIKAIEIDASKITSGELEAARIKSKDVVTQGLTADVVEATHIKSGTGLIDKIFANEALITRLTSNSIFASKIKAIEIDASKITSGELDAARIKSKDVVTQGLTADVVESTHIKAEAGLVGKLFSTTAYIEELTNKTIFTEKIQAINISADKITTGTLDASKVKVVNLDAANITTGNLKSINIVNTISYPEGGRTYTGDMTIAGGQISSYVTAGSGYYKSIFLTDRTIRISNQDATLNMQAGKITFDGTLTGGGQIWYQDNLARLVAGSYNGFALATYRNGTFSNRLSVGGWAGEALAPFIDVHATMNMRYNKIENLNGLFMRTDESKTGAAMYATTDNNLSLGGTWGTVIGHLGSDGKTVYEFLKADQASDRVRFAKNINMQGNTILNQSDERLKHNIYDLERDDLSILKEMRYKNFTFNNQEKETFGFLAQDLQEIMPSLIMEETDGYLSYDSMEYTHFIGHALQQHVTKTDDEITQLKAQIASLQDELALLKGA